MGGRGDQRPGGCTPAAGGAPHVFQMGKDAAGKFFVNAGEEGRPFAPVNQIIEINHRKTYDALCMLQAPPLEKTRSNAYRPRIDGTLLNG